LDDKITEDKLEELLSKLIKYLKKKAIYIEFRNLMDYSGHKHTFEKCGFNYKPHLNYKLFVSNPDVMINRLNESKRRQIKKTVSAGVKYVKSNDVSDLEAYYKILTNTYRTKIRLPLFPIEFFLNLMKCDFGHMLVIKNNDEIIGGIVCVNDKNTLFEWYICGSNLSAQGIYPSVFATWSGILHAFNIGCKKFDFMGAGKPGKDYGVREFKSKFGGELVENGRFLYKCNPILYYLGKVAISLQRFI
jgi:serine/alanine adding enzyme